MRKYHFLVVAALVSAIVACLMVRTPDATAQVDDMAADGLETPAPPPGETPAVAVENGPPPNDPILDEEFNKVNTKSATAPATTPEPGPAPTAPTPEPESAKPAGKMKQAFKQTPAPKKKPASVGKKKTPKHAKNKKGGIKDKKKKKKTKHS